MSNEIFKVLVVDDEEGIRDGCKRVIERMDFPVETAENGEIAIEKFKKDKYSIILLDLKMPGMDGISVLKVIKEIDPAVIIIIITGYATIDTAIEAMKQGAYDFISKPFEPEHLRIVFNKASEKLFLELERTRLQAEKQSMLLDLAEEKSRIRSIIDFLPNGLFVTNAENKVVFMNTVFRSDFDITVDEGLSIDSYTDNKTYIKHIESFLDLTPDDDEIPHFELKLPNGKFLLSQGKPIFRGDISVGSVFIFLDITEIKALESLKADFVAKVTHELRSPLATIHEQLAVVMKNMPDTSEKDDKYILSRAKEKTKGLISLISDLLDMSRIEEGVHHYDTRKVNIPYVLENIVDFLRSRADSKKQSLTYECHGNVPEITGNQPSIESIFGNLITNAIIYTPEEGSIFVKVSLKDKYISVEVIDTGYGMDKKHIDKIFDKFYRVKDDNTRFITGTGLGLPIVKALVEALSGKIVVESSPGKGSTFTVLLPFDN
ncbi:MAG: response regulator [Desulfobacterales bacterium]|nr:response regulator [Desulfobacterales bacterium]MCP4161952.1 response regulator [Deltaproteobacteria bacterium]